MTRNVLRACIGCIALSCVLHADPLWSGTYNGPYNSYDEVHAIGTDDSGNVIVSGFSELGQYDAEFVTIKYHPNGDTTWLRHFNPGSGLDGATALAVDRSGNIVVTGYLGGPSSEYGDWVTIKYSAAGESLWAVVYDDGDRDRPSCVVVDSAGNSYVTGRAGWLNDLDYVVVKHDPAGNEVWVFRYNGGDDDLSNAVALDAQGRTYLTGFSRRGGNYGDLMTWKLGVGGESLWANVYDGPAGRHDAGTAIAVDDLGNVVTAGSSNDPSGRDDYITIKYSPAGETLWTRRYDGPDSQGDLVKGLALDATGNVYVTGTSQTNSGYNYVTIKYAADGGEGWAIRYAGPRGHDDAAGVALDSDANVYVTGSSTNASNSWDVVTIKYDSAGNQRWLERFDMPSTFDEGYVMALSRQGTVYVGGRTDNDTTGIDYLTLAYGAAGAVTERTLSAEVRTPSLGPTLVRGSLLLPSSLLTAHYSLLSPDGRKVLDLRPGANDVRCLSPGVYFVSERSAVGGQRSAVHKVVVTR